MRSSPEFILETADGSAVVFMNCLLMNLICPLTRDSMNFFSFFEKMEQK
jgi:hypothetical protein